MTDFTNMGPVPYITAEQMAEVDRVMIEDYRINLTMMMENAGRNLAHLSRNRFLDNHPGSRRIVVLAGIGGNGGGALVCARRLWNWGADIHIYINVEHTNYKHVTAQQLYIARKLGIPIDDTSHLAQADTPELIIDGLIGYGLQGKPSGAVSKIIDWANTSTGPVLALDIPSGLNATSGIAQDAVIRATSTMTLALPKEGLRGPGQEKYVGELYLADIGVPPSLYAELYPELNVDLLFSRDDVIRI